MTAMMSSTETLFLRHFGAPTRQGGGGRLQTLNPTQKPGSHNTTFFLGEPQEKKIEGHRLTGQNNGGTLSDRRKQQRVTV